MHLLIALSLLAGGAGNAQPGSPTLSWDAQQGEIDRAGLLINEGKPSAAITILDAVIAVQDRERAADKRRAYCARGEAEAGAYERAGTREGKPFVVLPRTACYSYYLKGFALIDLHRDVEARPWYERVLAMAPSNSQFLGEMGEWYKRRRDWPQARGYFEKALVASDLSPEERRNGDRSRALRGIGFVLIEQGRLDEAEKMLRQALEIDPNDSGARSELQYISEQRGKRI